MKKYETIIIIDPKLKDKEIKGTIEKFKNMMQEYSDKDVKFDDYGMKKLAYEIKHNSTGYYAGFFFDSEPQNIAELERNLRIDDNVIKFMTVVAEEYEHNDEEEDEEEY